MICARAKTRRRPRAALPTACGRLGDGCGLGATAAEAVDGGGGLGARTAAASACDEVAWDQRRRPGAGSEVAWARGGLGRGRRWPKAGRSPRPRAALARGGEATASTGRRWPGATAARCAGGVGWVCALGACVRGVTAVRGTPLFPTA